MPLRVWMVGERHLQRIKIRLKRNSQKQGEEGAEDELEAITLGYENVLFPFVCLALGVILAGLVSLVEKYPRTRNSH